VGAVALLPIGSKKLISRFLPYKRHIVRGVHLRSMTMELIHWVRSSSAKGRFHRLGLS